jgi:low temperature requirement protein LtrA
MSEAFAIFVTIICIWWIYFDWDYDTSNLTNTRKAFAYNYGQLIIYAMLTIIASGVVCYLQNDLRGSELIIGGVAAFVLSILSINLLGGRWLWTRLAKIYLLAAVALLLIIAVKIVVLPTAIDHSNLLVFGSAGVLVTLCILQSFYCPKSIRSA